MRGSEQCGTVATRSVQSVAKDFVRQHYERYGAMRSRPPGRGALYDFAVGVWRPGAPKPKSGRPAPQLPHTGQAEDRWDAEGGKTQGNFMDWDRIQANWQHFKAAARERWGRISADELDLIDGRRDQLAGQIEEVYGITREAAQMQVESWCGLQREP
jgi:uncharacterized protein YjbJ (UPF0337 family)